MKDLKLKFNKDGLAARTVTMVTFCVTSDWELFFDTIVQLPLSARVVRSLDCRQLIANTAPDQCKNTDNSEPNNMCHFHVEIPENKSQHCEQI